MDTLFSIAIVVAALSTALMAGVYFAFSGFIMISLKSLTSHESVAAMNAINTKILSSIFMPLFWGSTALAVYLSIHSSMLGLSLQSLLVLSASLVYFCGMFLCMV